MGQLKEFSASLGVTALLITLTVTAVLIAISLTIILLLVPPFDIINISIAGVVTFGIIMLYFFVYMLRPSKYLIDHEKIIIKRRLRTVKIYFSEIQDVFIVNKHTMSEMNRIGGSAGLFGFFGDFQTRFGKTTFYATRLDKFILVRTAADEKIVLTPDKMSMYYELKDALNGLSDKSPINLFK